jgi:hypothetical protein
MQYHSRLKKGLCWVFDASWENGEHLLGVEGEDTHTLRTFRKKSIPLRTKVKKARRNDIYLLYRRLPAVGGR